MSIRSLLRTVPLILLVVAACERGETPPEAPPEPSEVSLPTFEDPQVTRIYHRMMETIAPGGGWARARYLEFTRQTPGGARRRHAWDRFEGRARVEGPTEDGVVVAIFPTDDPTAGQVWRNAEQLSGEAAEEVLNWAYRSHINDAYWLLMPFKWADPGVSAVYLGEEEDEEGQLWEVVELSFDDGVGLTPQNRYHAFVHPETGRMERWHHFSDPDADPTPADWTEWRQVGPLELAVNRRTNGEIRSSFPHLRVETETPEGAFDPPM